MECALDVLNSMRLYRPPSRRASEDIEGLHTRRARSETTASHSARPRSPYRCQPRALPETSLARDGRYPGRTVVDEHKLEMVGSALDIDYFSQIKTRT